MEGSSGGSAQPPAVLRCAECHQPPGAGCWPENAALSAPPLSCQAVSSCSELALLQPVNVVGEFERGPQLQPHVLHHHVAAQQEQGLAVDLL